MKKLLSAALLLIASAASASAQSTCPTIIFGAVLTAAQWNACFQSKQDLLGFVPLNKAGDTMGGRLNTVASTTVSAGFRLNVGAAPTTPSNGDVWMTTAGLFFRANGATVSSAGTTVPNTWTALQSFTDPDFALLGSSSGSLVLRAAAAAGSSIIRFPAGSTDFTATGGTSQFVRQNSAGGALDVVRPAITDLSGLGTGVATFLATPSSVNLLSALTTSTGTGSAVFGTSPTIATPNLTAPVLKGSSSGGVTLTAPAAAGSNTITFPAGTTDFSSTGGTTQVVRQSAAGAALTVGPLLSTEVGGAARFGFTNCAITAAVAGNNLTVNLTDNAGSTPSSTSPCVIYYRSATASAGSWVSVSTTAAVSFTANSGSTFGVTNTSAQCLAASSCPFQLWVVGVYNGSGTSLGVVALSNASGVLPLKQSGLYTTTACNACASATALGTIYTTAAQTSEPIVLLGRLEWGSGLATAGTYASGPTLVQSMGPGIRVPGDVVQILQASSATQTATTSSTPAATNLSKAITPSSAANLVRVSWSSSLTNANGHVSTAVVTLQRAGANIGPAANIFADGGGVTSMRTQVGESWIDSPGTASQITYQAFVLSQDNTTSVVFCGNPGGGITTSANCKLTIEEIQG